MPDDGKSMNEAAADQAGELFTWLFIAFIIVRIIERLPQVWENFVAQLPTGLLSSLWSWTYGFYIFLAVILTMLFLAGIIYAVRHTSEIRLRQKQEASERVSEALSGPSSPLNPRWQHVEDLAGSDSERDWRLAIIEADIMLDEMMRILGYSQDTLGDKLHAAGQSDFRTIDQAWKAHKLRNQIAHEGSAYRLSRRETQQAIDLYRQVFEEFSYLS